MTIFVSPTSDSRVTIHDHEKALPTAVSNGSRWTPAETFESGIRKTVQWYLDHPQWVQEVQSGAYRDWVQSHYAQAGSAA